MSSVVFWSILFLMVYIRPIEIILAKKTTEIVLLFHKNTTKLVFLWPNMGQKCIKMLSIKILLFDCVIMFDYEFEKNSFISTLTIIETVIIKNCQNIIKFLKYFKKFRQFYCNKRNTFVNIFS